MISVIKGDLFQELRGGKIDKGVMMSHQGFNDVGGTFKKTYPTRKLKFNKSLFGKNDGTLLNKSLITYHLKDHGIGDEQLKVLLKEIINENNGKRIGIGIPRSLEYFEKILLNVDRKFYTEGQNFEDHKRIIFMVDTCIKTIREQGSNTHVNLYSLDI